MLGSILALAQIDSARKSPGPQTGGDGVFDSTDALIILGFVFLVAVALISWAYFLRRFPDDLQDDRLQPPAPQRRDRRAERVPDPLLDGSGGKLRRRRRLESSARRNPTLREKGGLPPPRLDEPEEPSSAGPTAPVIHPPV